MRLVSALLGVFFLAIQANSALAIEVLDQKSLDNFDSIDFDHPDYKYKIASCFMFDMVAAGMVSEESGKTRQTILFKDSYYKTYSKGFFKFIGQDFGAYINKDPKNRVGLMSEKLLVTAGDKKLKLTSKIFNICTSALQDMIISVSDKSPQSAAPKANNSNTHADCLEAKDYEGCMRYRQSGQSKTQEKDLCKNSVCIVTTKGSDIYGLPKPWNYRYYQLDDGRLMYWSRFYRIPHKGQEARYIGLKRITRYYRTPKAGTSGSFIGGGYASTNCTDYGGSVNCTTTGSTPTYIPGSSATPGGIVNAVFTHVFDCKDMTEASYKRGKLSGSWDKYNPKDFYHDLFKEKCALGTSGLKGLPVLDLKM